MFRVGQKVVCVDVSDIPDWHRTIWNYPVKGGVYTVSGVGNKADGCAILFLDEIVQPRPTDKDGFKATRFRPIVSRPTSIEFAHEILRSVSASTKERAHV